MTLSIESILLFLILGVPVAVIATEQFRFKGNRPLFFLAGWYCLLALNSICAVVLGAQYIVPHCIIDSIIIVGAAISLTYLWASAQRHGAWIPLAIALTVATSIGSIIWIVQNPDQQLIAIGAGSVAIGIISGSLLLATVAKQRSVIVVLCGAWIASHLLALNGWQQISTICNILFYGFLSFRIARHNYIAHRTIALEDAFLIRTREVTISMLNETSSTVENLRSIEQTIKSILDTVVQTIHAKGVCIFLTDTLEADRPTLRFSQSSGTVFPIATDKAGAFEPLETSVFDMAEGIVGAAAVSEKPVALTTDIDKSVMDGYGIDSGNIGTMVAVSVRIKETVLGVLVAQNSNNGRQFDTESIGILQAIADQTAGYINNINMMNELEKVDRMREEMRIATEIQTQVLPQQLPIVPGLSFATFFCPAREMGGDYYNFYPQPDGRLGMAIGDVSGRGIPASMITVIAHTALDIIAKALSDTREVVREFSRQMYLKMSRGQFMSLNFLMWDPKDQTLTYTGAGHEHIFWFHGKDHKLDKIKTGGIAIGLIEDSGPSLHKNSITLEPGDCVVLYTDGITEARNVAGEMFGLDRLGEIVSTHSAGVSSDNLKDSIVQSVRDFMGDQEQYDDISLIVMQRVDSN